MLLKAFALLAFASSILTQALAIDDDEDIMRQELHDRINQAASAQTMTGQNTTQSFLIKTRLLPNQSTTTNLSRFDNLYLSSVRTGAGTGDAVFTSNVTEGLQAFFNATTTKYPDYLAPLNFVGVSYPYAFKPTSSAYSDWSFVQINAGNDGAAVLKETLDYQYAGPLPWMVCDWWHGKPQLFIKKTILHPVTPPMGCADIELKKIWL